MSKTRGTLARIMRQAFWDYWDNLLRLTISNVLLFIILGSGVFFWILFTQPLIVGLSPAIAMIVILFTSLILLPPLFSLWLAPLGYWGGLISAEQDIGLRSYIQGFRQNFLRTWKLLALSMLIIFVLLTNIWFYAFSSALNDLPTFIRYSLAGISFWITVAATLVAMLAVPFLLRDGIGIKSALKQGFAILVIRPGVCVGICMILLPIWFIGISFKLVGLILFLFSATSVFLNSIYDVLKSEAAELEADAPASASSWEEIKAREAAKERSRMDEVRYGRTFRDILRPWEG